MLGVLVVLAVGGAAFAAGLKFFGVGSAIFLFLLAALPAAVLIVRLLRKRVDKASGEVEGHLKAQRFERAIERLEAMRPLARWQPLLGSSIEEQIGILRYAGLRDLDGARQSLERVGRKSGQAWAMLGACHFRQKRGDEAMRAFERGTKARKKDALLWAAWAWCEWKRGDRAAALKVLGTARQKLPDDDRLKRVQLTLQNENRMKMKPFGNEWLALQLEPAPGPAATGGISPTHPALRGMRGARMRVRMRG
jgi:tetratricopeptide (TPR) repeat protein